MVIYCYANLTNYSLTNLKLNARHTTEQEDPFHKSRRHCTHKLANALRYNSMNLDWRRSLQQAPRNGFDHLFH